MTLNLILLQREFRLKLDGAQTPIAPDSRRRYNHQRVKLAVPKECRPGERRVAVTPENVARLIKLGFAVAVEHDAGAAASFGDDDYVAAGAEIVADTRAIWQTGDIVLKVQPPVMHPALERARGRPDPRGRHADQLPLPGKNKEMVERLAARKATALAIDQIPRITRAQKMDALSSMANIAGYRAVDRGGELLRPLLHRPDHRRRARCRRPRCW